MKWRYSRRMMRVRCIFVLTTVPVRIRPRIETMPVKGHFLSVQRYNVSCFIFQYASFPPHLRPHLDSTLNIKDMRTDVFALNCKLWCPEAQTDVLKPSPSTFADLRRSRCFRSLLVVEKDVWLLLEGALALDCQFGGHDCGDEQSVCMAYWFKTISVGSCSKVDYWCG